MVDLKCDLGVLRFPVPGKQMRDIGSAVLIFWYSPDYVLQPFSRFYAACFAGRDERVDHQGAHGDASFPQKR